jgi:GTPase
LLDKERILAISKMDLVQDDEDHQRILKQIPEGLPYLLFSSMLQQGLVEMKDMIWKSLQNAQPPVVVVPEVDETDL